MTNHFFSRQIYTVSGYFVLLKLENDSIHEIILQPYILPAYCLLPSLMSEIHLSSDKTPIKYTNKLVVKHIMKSVRYWNKKNIFTNYNCNVFQQGIERCRSKSKREAKMCFRQEPIKHGFNTIFFFRCFVFLEWCFVSYSRIFQSWRWPLYGGRQSARAQEKPTVIRRLLQTVLRVRPEGNRAISLQWLHWLLGHKLLGPRGPWA